MLTDMLIKGIKKEMWLLPYDIQRKMYNKKSQSTAGSVAFFQRSFYIKAQCDCRVHLLSASGH